MVPGFLNAQNFRNLIKRFQEFLEFRDFCPIVLQREAAGVPLHYGHVVVQWITTIEINSVKIF